MLSIPNNKSNREAFELTRRNVLAAAAVSIATLGLSPISTIQAADRKLPNTTPKGSNMTTVRTKDGAEIFYKDWGSGQPIVFSHGWPLNSDAFEYQMHFLATQGYRCIAHDRRGHGRSTQTWGGNDMDTYVADLAAITEALGIRDAIHIGHSTGGGEVTRYVARYGDRVSKAITIAAIPPLMLKTDANPGGQPREAFDKVRESVLADRSQFWKDLSLPFFGYNRPGAKVSEGARDAFWMHSMVAGFPASYFGIKAWSETDFTDDLKKIRLRC